MPRKTTKSLERKVSPDRKYQSILVQRLINKSMLDGKKQAAERAVYAAIEGAAKKLKSENPVEVLEKAIPNCWSPPTPLRLFMASSIRSWPRRHAIC